MGFRFRRSLRFGPFRMNISKSGIGYSVGGPGARITKRADGKTQTTLSIPGTGISHVTVSGQKDTVSEQEEPNKSGLLNLGLWLVIVLMIWLVLASSAFVLSSLFGK
jgi:hypothetical protein